MLITFRAYQPMCCERIILSIVIRSRGGVCYYQNFSNALIVHDAYNNVAILAHLSMKWGLDHDAVTDESWLETIHLTSI